ncbi:MAG: hypothetical protein K2M73_02010 [Lachnospiraceae bacterium]|nr:hypothetical protein [Lachnospiraceae bacterium]
MATRLFEAKNKKYGNTKNTKTLKLNKIVNKNNKLDILGCKNKVNLIFL